MIGINKKGSCKPGLHEIIRKIWLWALDRKIWLSAVHIPGKENVDADFESRNRPSSAEWSLKREVFDILQQKLGDCQVDLFASRLNNKLDRFISRFPDPKACAIDAFFYDWTHERLYIFPLFRLLGRVLKKMLREQVEAILILPFFMAKRLSALLCRLLIRNPFWIPHQALFLPHSLKEIHPMGDRLNLLACAVSSLHGKNKVFLDQLGSYSVGVGRTVPRRSTSLILRSGRLSVPIERLIL